MRKLIFILFLFLLSTTAHSTIKENIINNLINIKNLNFDFEQNINGKIETGNCTVEYPKKIINKIFFIKKHLFYQHDLLYLQFLLLPSYQ